MNCKKFAGYLEDYFEGTLSEDLRTEIEEHIVICNYCAADFNKMKLYFEKVASLPMTFTLPKSWTERILAKFNEGVYGENDVNQRNTKDKVLGFSSSFSRTGEKNKSKNSKEQKPLEKSDNITKGDAEKGKNQKSSDSGLTDEKSDNAQTLNKDKFIHPVLLTLVILLAFAILIYTILHYSLKIL